MVTLLHPHSVISFSHVVKGKVQNCLEMHSLITGCRWISPEDMRRFYGIHHIPTLKERVSTLLLVKALGVENRRAGNIIVHESPVGKGLGETNPQVWDSRIGCNWNKIQFWWKESSIRKVFKVLFRHFFSSLIHVDEEISLQTGQKIFREAKLNTGKKIIRSKVRNSWISFAKIKIQKEITALGKAASMVISL